MYTPKTTWTDAGGSENTVTASTINGWEQGIAEAENGEGMCFTTTGSGGSYALSTGNALTTFNFGFTIRFKANHTSSSACTLNVDDTISIPIRKKNGDTVTELHQNGIYTVTFDSAQVAFFVEGNTAPDPAGEVKMLAMSSVPSGFLECDGSAVSRASYSRLFTAIGTTYGAGDGSTTFNVPDFRGEFIRGWDHGRGVDSGRAIGTAQAGANAAHTHTGTTASNGAHTHTVPGQFVASDPGGSDGEVPSIERVPSSTYNTGSAGAHTHTITTDSSGSEARPRNFALMYVIRY